jgi:hypothetical protein
MTKKNISKKKYLTKEDINYRDFDNGKQNFTISIMEKVVNVLGVSAGDLMK